MDWREYIQEKEQFAAPEPHIGHLLAAMNARPGATRADEELAELRLAEKTKARPRPKPKKTAHMSWDEYREFKQQTHAA